MESSLPRWIHASIANHFNTYRMSLPLFLEEQVREDQELVGEFMELRIDGPIVRQYSPTQFEITLEINVLLQVVKKPTDMFHVQRQVGVVIAAFHPCIDVREYGEGQPDPPTLVGTLVLQTHGRRNMGIVVSNFGQINPTERLHHVTIEGKYVMDYRE